MCRLLNRNNIRKIERQTGLKIVWAKTSKYDSHNYIIVVVSEDEGYDYNRKTHNISKIEGFKFSIPQ